MRRARSCYSVVEYRAGKDPSVLIVDHDCGLSVTNDAEAVVADILREYGPVRIYYRDTMGLWDELSHDGIRFTGFRILSSAKPPEREGDVSKLYDYVIGHTTILVPEVWKMGEKGNVLFFQVAPLYTMEADELRKQIAGHHSEFGDIDLFDGEQHSYVELGAWVGDQACALRLMGAGEVLGLWDVLEPRRLGASEKQAREMAGMGLVCIIAPRTTRQQD